MARDIVTVEGRKVELSNLDKVFYPETGFTKAQVIDYYRRVASYILPHLEGRPVTLKRYPDGVAGHHFYEKTCPSYRPNWVDTSGGKGGLPTDFCIIDSLPSLIWVANLASIELHTLLGRVPDLTRPTMVAFDLDPGPPATLLDCLEVALTMRDMLGGLGLETFPKTSGGKGLHFYVPLNTVAMYDQTKHFAKTVAQTMEKHYPDRVVSKMTKSLRKGKVLVDWSQNTEHKTTVCAYSLRAGSRPTVSMPVSWEEVEKAAEKKDAEGLIHTPDEAIERLEKQGDLFAPVLTLRQDLPDGMQKGKAGRGQHRTLGSYRQKRDFTKTPEPSGGRAEAGTQTVFVIQKHSARRLHYDLRLEVEGVLKSWSVPKGPSSDPSDRRLAVQTEDHPLAYQDFEGVIPKGEYGGGQMIIWDTGRYRNITGDPKKPVPMAKAVEDGKIEIFFEGEKVRGGYALIEMRKKDENRRNWLLIKLKDEHVGSLPRNLEELGESVTTGRTVEDLKGASAKRRSR